MKKFLLVVLTIAVLYGLTVLADKLFEPSLVKCSISEMEICDDGDPKTRDICSPTTDEDYNVIYYCENIPVKEPITDYDQTKARETAQISFQKEQPECSNVLSLSQEASLPSISIWSEDTSWCKWWDFRCEGGKYTRTIVSCKIVGKDEYRLYNAK